MKTKQKMTFVANGREFKASSIEGAKRIASRLLWDGKIKGWGYLGGYVDLSCEGKEISTYCETTSCWVDNE